MSFLNKQLDFLAIGDITTDAFIRLKDAHISCKVNKEDCELCMRFGDKIPFEYVKVVKAVGNAANASVCASRLNLKSAIISNVGNDQNGIDCMNELQKNKVITSFIKTHPNKSTNYHFILWYGTDRTILVNHTEFDYKLPEKMQKHTASGRYNSQGLPPKWIYLTSLAANAFPYHMSIADYLEANPSVKLAFQPGTFQIKAGVKELKRIYDRTDFYAVNLDEALRIIEKELPGENIPRNDIKKVLKTISDFGPKLVAITDGTNGAYLFDGDHYYHMPIYPDPRPALERTGCGDAWSATFVSAMAMGKTPIEALQLAPINPMSVAQFIGAQEGLLAREQLEWWLERAPHDYKVREI